MTAIEWINKAQEILANYKNFTVYEIEHKIFMAWKYLNEAKEEIKLLEKAVK